jgi:hypothetical protein
MPVSPRLTSLLDRALDNRILSQREIRRIRTEVQKDGVSPEEVDAVVTALAEAMQDGLELDTVGRRKRLNQLLTGLEAHHPTGLTPEARPDGSLDFIGALALRAGGGALEEVDLPTPSFAGKTVGVDDDGTITLDGAPVPLDAGRWDAKTTEALLGLVRPAQLDALTDEVKGALAENLVDALAETWPVASDGDNAFSEVVGSVASLAALGRMPKAIDEATADRLIALAENAPNPMAKAQLISTLGAAELTPAQGDRLAAMERPEHIEELLEAWTKMADGDARIGWRDAEGGIQQVGLSGLAFCKKPASIENLYGGLEAWSKLSSDGNTPWNPEELTQIATVLEDYVHEHDAVAYVFGTFKSDAPKKIAGITNAQLQERLLPKLEGANPRLGDVKLTGEQATWLKGVLAGVKDQDAADKLETAMREAAMLSSTKERGYGEPPVPNGPLSVAAFELLQRSAVPFVDSAGGNEDGMINVSALGRAVQDQTTAIRKELRPRLVSLGETPPSWGGYEVSPDTAELLRGLASDHVRSAMSVSNLDKAMGVIAAKHGGVTGPGAEVFEKIVREYMANWPDLNTFDFNKLERIASFAVEGKDVPLCTLNGEQVGLAEFYGRVSGAVTDSMDRSLLRHEWMAHRWGFRAQESVELLDVIAEQAARGEGAVAQLQARFPDKKIVVHATGLDGVHQQFLFHVMDGDRSLEVYNQGADGTLGRYTERKDPVLFTAEVNDDGSFDVKVPDNNRVKKYPLQSTYGVGDVVDYHFYDSQATELRNEGEKFETRAKVLKGVIKGFDADGNYTVEVHKPGGDTEERTLTLDKLRRMNHPHYFSEDGSYLRDVEINIKDDAPLKDFLENADPRAPRTRRRARKTRSIGSWTTSTASPSGSW